MIKALLAIGLTAAALLLAWCLETLRDEYPRLFVSFALGAGIAIAIALVAVLN
jgi:hypothetical protein